MKHAVMDGDINLWMNGIDLQRNNYLGWLI